MRAMSRQTRALATISIAVFLLSGCVITTDDSGRGSPAPETTAELYEQAMANREQFWKELDDMEKVVGGTWSVHDDRIAENCLGRMHDNHYQYRGDRSRSTPVEDAQAAADALQKFWDDFGYTTQQISYGPDHLLVAAKDANGWSLTFLTEGEGAERQTSLVGETGCFRGDYGAVLDYQVRWEKDHPQPTPAPTDEQSGPAE